MAVGFLKVTPRRDKNRSLCVEHWKPVFIKFKDHFNFEIIWCVKKKDFFFVQQHFIREFGLNLISIMIILSFFGHNPYFKQGSTV